MASTRVITGMFLIGALAATPALAEEGQHRQRNGGRGQDTHAARQAPPPAERRERAVPRTDARPRDEVRRDFDNRRDWNGRGRDGNQRDRGWNGRDDRSRSVPRGGYAYRGRPLYVPRVIRPRIITVVPYRPYVYRPSLSLGAIYGSGGAYPYGYTPRGYYDPVPGRPYGGVRITGAPRDAQVFADGYYVGIVNDFDGVFQHMNLEAGPHHIEIDIPGAEPIAFDVLVRPGETTTFRAY
jgi:hypothetical protein